MKFVTADCHFYHDKIIEFCERPFSSVEEMNKALIENWNAVVNPEDETYVVGDFAFFQSKDQARGLAAKLNGRKYLIKGNHDQREYCNKAFEWVKEYHSFTEYGLTWVLFHYPIWCWDGRGQGSIHLYGHVHNRVEQYVPGDMDYEMIQALAKRTDCFNVGVDVNGFTPVSLATLAQKIKWMS